MTLRRFLLGRPPSWPEIGVAIIVTALLVPLKTAEPTVSSWLGAAVGFLAAGFVVGPYAGSRLHTQVTDWFESASVGRRWGVRLALVVGLVAVTYLFIPAEIVFSITEGMLFGVTVVYWLQLLAFRTVVDHTAV